MGSARPRKPGYKVLGREAAHLEPEILIIDEVLAVGDASFQRKCIKKMGSVAGEPSVR